MATQTLTSQSSSHRGVAMLLALASAIALSPLYVNRRTEARRETRWSYGFVQPMVLAGLIMAIKAVSISQRSSSNSSSSSVGGGGQVFSSLDSSSVLRIGSSSWGLAGVLVMLMLVLSWQGSVQEFFWR